MKKITKKVLRIINKRLIKKKDKKNMSLFDIACSNYANIAHILKFVIYEGNEILELRKGIWGIPAIIFFGPGA